MNNSKIAGTGSYLPKNIVTNADLEARVNTTDQWIRERTGIHQRHIADETETCAFMATQACARALEAAGMQASDIDLIVLATTTPDRVFPSTACLVQHALGVSQCAAFDVSAACAGFVYAFSVADQFIRGGMAKNALVVGSEVYSKILDWDDRTTCVLFGDGAGAVVLSASEEKGVLSTHLHADGTHADLLGVNWGVAKGYDRLDEGRFLTMKGNEVFKVAVRTLGRIVDETLEANNIQKKDIDWLVPHQANIRIIQATAKKLELSMDQVVVTVDKHGNTSSASIPLALDSGIREGSIKRGELLLLEGFGGGFTWGSALIRY